MKQRLTIFALLLAMVSAFSLAKEESLEELKKRADSARPEDRVGVCLKIAQMQLRSADKLYDQGKTEDARAAVEDIAVYSEKAGVAAAESRKHQKNVEIGVRKMAEKLQDIKHSLNLEDQAPIERTIQRLEAIRTDMLKAMFGKEKK